MNQGIVFIQNGKVLFILVKKNPTLKMSVLGKAVVAIKMIGANIENTGDKGMKFFNSF